MKNAYTTTHIVAKEGWNTLIVVGMLFLCAYALSFMTWFFFALCVFTLLLYRNPERLSKEEDPLAIMAPVDGKISCISKISDDEGKEWLRVIITKRIFDVGLVRAPLNLHVTQIQKRNGLGMNFASPLAKALREKITLTCNTSQGHLFKIRLYAGLLCKTMTLFGKPQSLKSTGRFAFLSEGEVALFLPLDTRLKVVLGDEVKAAESLLGYFAYKV